MGPPGASVLPVGDSRDRHSSVFRACRALGIVNISYTSSAKITVSRTWVQSSTEGISGSGEFNHVIMVVS